MITRRAKLAGGSYFFTVHFAERSRVLRVDSIETLRNAVRAVWQNHPFDILAWGVTRSPARHLAITGGRRRQRNAMDADQVGFFAWYSERRMGAVIPPEEARERRMATAVLGASDHQRRRPAKTYGLRAFQSGETWLRKACFGLALQFDTPRCPARMDVLGLGGGWECVRGSGREVKRSGFASLTPTCELRVHANPTAVRLKLE